MQAIPAVYAGPSISSEDVQQWLPYAQVFRPIQRGDLYRDRLLGFRVFLIIDGVFHQELAISPREVIDIVRDGGVVFGAASMGALRAAECWPAGARGIGSIYRMFRRGHLTSDDEVAVAFSPHEPYPCVSVPLVNLRYAVHRAVRTGKLAPTDAERIVNCAREHYYVERTWRSIFRCANISDSDGRLAEYLGTYDLKRLDAVRALKCVRNSIEKLLNEFDVAPSHPGQVFLATRPREATNTLDVSRPRFRRNELWRWLIASGVYRRYIGGASTTWPLGNELPTSNAPDLAGIALADEQWPSVAHGTSSEWAKVLELGSADIQAAVQEQRVVVASLQHLTKDNTDIARGVLAGLLISGDIDAVVLKFLAQRDAAEWARASGCVAQPQHHVAAMYEIARSHGFRSWPQMQDALQHNDAVWQWIERFLDDFELIKTVRDELFQNPHATEHLSRFSTEMHRGD